MNILAIEVDTSAIQAAVLDVATTQPIGAVSTVKVTLEAPTRDASEIPASRLWEGVARAARQAVRAAGVAGRPGQDIAGIGLSTFMPGLVLLGKDDAPLGPIWTHLDRRARPAARQVAAHVGEEFWATTGNRPLPGLISALSWRQQHGAEPYLSHRVASYLHVNGWLAFHMTGNKACDPASASVTGLFATLGDQTWSTRWCDYFEVEHGWLPPIVDGNATVGTTSPAIAAELGVPAGIPVKLGAAPTGSASLAAHLEPGEVLQIVDAKQTLATIVDAPTPMPRGWIHRLGVGTKFVQVAHNPVGIGAVDWLRTLCFREQSDAEFWQQMVPRAEERKTRITLDPPFLVGDCLEIEASRAAFRDLELSADRLDLLAALLGALRQRHEEAMVNLRLAGQPRRVVLAGAAPEAMRRLIPSYRAIEIDRLDDGPLRGAACLFADVP